MSHLQRARYLVGMSIGPGHEVIAVARGEEAKVCLDVSLEDAPGDERPGLGPFQID